MTRVLFYCPWFVPMFLRPSWISTHNLLSYVLCFAGLYFVYYFEKAMFCAETAVLLYDDIFNATLYTQNTPISP